MKHLKCLRCSSSITPSALGKATWYNLYARELGNTQKKCMYLESANALRAIYLRDKKEKTHSDLGTDYYSSQDCL